MSAPPFDPKQYKAKQKQEWDSTAEGWKKWREPMEATAQPISDRMVELADLRPGQRVLDVATGAGEPAVTAARRVGPSGRVLGTDLSPAMLANARERVAGLGLENLEFQEIDAESLEFPEGSFDAALCRFGLMFLPSPGSAVRRIREALVPGGTFVAATWSAPTKVPMIGLPMASIQKVLDLPPPPPGAPNPFSLATPDAVHKLFADAGLRGVRSEPFTMNASFPSVGGYIDFIRDIAAPVRGALANQSSDHQATVWRVIEEGARSYAAPDGTVRMPNEGLFVIGRR